MPDYKRPFLGSAPPYVSNVGPRGSTGLLTTWAAEELSSSVGVVENSYTYSPLKEKDSIRLLQIQPADEINADLHLSIVHTTLSNITATAEDPLAFTALSYFWGLQVDTRPVYINVDKDDGEKATLETSDESTEGPTTEKSDDPTRKPSESALGSSKQVIEQSAKEVSKQAIQQARNNLTNPTSTKELRVGSNLHSALRHLRSKTADVVVWADGLCINQRDVRERNHQVHHMRAIYERANETVVYLGDEGGNTCLSAWNFLEREAAGEGEKEGDVLMEFRGDLGDVEIDVLNRPWFRRVWVVQEVVVSRDITMKCGTRSIPWDHFCKIVLLGPRLNDRYGFSLRNKNLFEYVVELFLTRCAFLISHGLQHNLPPWYSAIEDNEARSDHILDMVVRSRRLGATDPRDKIFALIGISSGVDPEDTRIAVDYSKSLERVYIDFAVYLIDSKRGFDILSHAELNGASEASWPCWVPDWRFSLRSPRTILSTLPVESEEQNRQRRQVIRKNHHHPQDALQLQCYGEIIGRISTVTPRLLLRGNDELAFEQIRQKFKARPQQMRTQILERWKMYPWTGAVPGEVYDSILKRDSNTYGARPSSYSGWAIGRGNEIARSRFRDNGVDLWYMGTASESRLNRIMERLGGEGAASISPSSSLVSRTIVDHLIYRSRQTLLWTDDRSLAVEAVIDKTSIIDDRRLGLFIKPNKEVEVKVKIKDDPVKLFSITRPGTSQSYISDENPVLVPATTNVGDYVVSLKGGKVAFVIRMKGSSRGLGSEASFGELPERIRCELVGECLINDYGAFDVGSEKNDHTNPSGQTSFVFGVSIRADPSSEGLSGSQPIYRGALPKQAIKPRSTVIGQKSSRLSDFTPKLT